MANRNIFKDYDLEDVYHEAQVSVLSRDARNFVVEFGQKKSHIAFDLELPGFEAILDRDAKSRSERPVRWM